MTYVRLAIVSVIALVVVAFSYTKAHPHDMYTGLQKDGTYGVTSPCCGNTDCEALEIDAAAIQPDGSAIIFSQRHQANVHVPAHKITPVALPKDANGKWHPVHWCGDKRKPNYVPYGYSSPAPPAGTGEITPPTEDQPDPVFVTFCSFIAPGGV